MCNSLIIITLILFCCIPQFGNASIVTDVYTTAVGISFSFGFVSILSRWGTEYGGLPGNRNPAAGEVEMKWIANDERRHTKDGLDFYVHIDSTELPSSLKRKNLNAEMAIGAIKNAVNTWNNVACSKEKFNLIVKNDYNGHDIGFAEYLYTQGKSGRESPIGDIVFGGFLPSHLFNDGESQPNGNISITAITIFFDFGGQIIDFSQFQNELKVQEIAFAEIYFNDFFDWDIMSEDSETSETTTYRFDIETVALHEMGHALSQAHFHRAGKYMNLQNRNINIFKEKDKKSVAMAPLYSGVNHDLHGIDISGHCQIWSSWGLRKAKQAKQAAVVNEYAQVAADYSDENTYGYASNSINALIIGMCILIGLLITNIVLIAINCKNKKRVVYGI